MTCSCSSPKAHLASLTGADSRELQVWLDERVKGLGQLPPRRPAPDQRTLILQPSPHMPPAEMAGFARRYFPECSVVIDWADCGPQSLHVNGNPLAIQMPAPLMEPGAKIWPVPEQVRSMLEELFQAVEHGVQYVHYDGSALLRSGANVPTTRYHLAARLMRAVLEEMGTPLLLAVSPYAPSDPATAGFGNGRNEAHLVEAAALPALLLQAFRQGDPSALNAWASQLRPPSQAVTFFNTLSPSGGIRPELASGAMVVPAAQIQPQLDFVTQLADSLPEMDAQTRARVLLAAQAIAFSLSGLPGLALETMLGEVPPGTRLEDALADPQSTPAPVFNGTRRMLQARASCPAFHPFGVQLVLDVEEPVFALMRLDPDASSMLLSLTNVSGKAQMVPMNLHELGLQGGNWTELISAQKLELQPDSVLRLASYQSAWLVPERI